MTSITEPSGFINEVLAHTDLPDLDAVELLNTTNSPVDIGGWWLTDSGADPLRYQIPASTILPAGGYVTFDENQFITGNTAGTPFAFNADEGDEVFLTRASGTAVTHFEDVVQFGATFNGQTLGHTPDGSRLVPLASNGLGSINGGYAFADVMISEINYHPADPINPDPENPIITAGDLEFIEVTNTSGVSISQADWRLRGEADFNFASGQILGPQSSLVVISFYPTDLENSPQLTAFRAHYGIGLDVMLAGPMTGSLSNSHGLVKLQQPDDPAMGVDPPVIPHVNAFPHINVDEFLYDDLGDWPTAADGSRPSLQRIGKSTLGAYAESWLADSPTPGSVPDGPGIQSVVFNQNDSGRSEVTSISIQFDELTLVSPESFEIRNLATDEVVRGVSVSSVNNGMGTLATLTFSGGPSVVTGTNAAIAPTLADGQYDLRYRGLGFGTTANQVDSFFRKFGDADGDGNVGLTDIALFRDVFGTSESELGSSFNSQLDANRDGVIGLADFAEFRGNFGI